MCFVAATLVYILLSIVREGRPRPNPTATPSISLRDMELSLSYLFIKETGPLNRKACLCIIKFNPTTCRLYMHATRIFSLYSILSILCVFHMQPLEDPVLCSHCELAMFSDAAKKEHTVLLSAFREDTSNIPEFGTRNCQDWTVAAVHMLEQAGVLNQGEGDFWKGMVNLSVDEMRDSCLCMGRKWIMGPELTLKGVPDAWFSNETDLTV